MASFWLRRSSVWAVVRECVLRMPWRKHGLVIWEEVILSITAQAAPPVDALVGVIAVASAVAEAGGDVPTSVASALVNAVLCIGRKMFEMRNGDVDGGPWHDAADRAMLPCIQLLQHQPAAMIAAVVTCAETAIQTSSVGKATASVNAIASLVVFLLQQQPLRQVWKGLGSEAKSKLKALSTAVQLSGGSSEQLDSEVMLLRL